MINKMLIVLAGVLMSSCVLGQQVNLFNPSFEGEPQDATMPIGWIGCEDGTTPDILPGPWGVYQPAYDGQSFMGLIVRKNGSWECIGQRLSQSLKAENCYFFKLMLANAKTYNGYNKPVVLRVWGGDDRCEKKQKLYESPPISHTDWRPYTIRFKPKKDIQFIIIEAFYNTKLQYTYNGNILLDAMSPISNCDRAELVMFR